MLWVFGNVEFRMEESCSSWSAQIDETTSIDLTVYSYSYFAGTVYECGPTRPINWWRRAVAAVLIRVFRPDLAHTSIVVLSNNDGCVIARSYDAKPFVRMGAPYFQI